VLQTKVKDIQSQNCTNRMNNDVKVNAVYVVKNEWPLLAVSISHALTNYADKVIIIDTGSEDGIFEGIRLLETLWEGRVQLFRCRQEIYDQIPLTNLLIEMSKENDADWTMILDADEFLVHNNYPELLAKLSQTDEKWSSYAIKVVNFIVDEKHDDSDLESFAKISYRINSQGVSQSPDDEYTRRVTLGEIPLQYRSTPDKLLVRNSQDIFISQGSHQVVFGDGIWWEKHDSSVASAGFLGGMICHLPYTSENRLIARKKRLFFDRQKTTFRLSTDQLSDASPSALRKMAVLNPKNRDQWLQAGVITTDNAFEESLKPVIDKLQKFWPQLTLATFKSEVADSFPDSLDLKIVSKLIRKYHSRAETMWDGQR